LVWKESARPLYNAMQNAEFATAAPTTADMLMGRQFFFSLPRTGFTTCSAGPRASEKAGSKEGDAEGA